MTTWRKESWSMFGEERANNEPYLDDDGDEFQDIDVMKVGVNEGLAVLGVVVAICLAQTRGNEFWYGDAPHEGNKS